MIAYRARDHRSYLRPAERALAAERAPRPHPDSKRQRRARAWALRQRVRETQRPVRGVVERV